MSITPFLRRGIFDDPTSFDVWDPFTTASPSGSRSRETTDARMDWRETSDAHVFKADLPGVRKDEVKVEVEDGRVLQISGQRSREAEDDKKDTWHRLERSVGSFFRRFRLPENAKAEETKAGMENGVLTVTVPKQEAGKKKDPDIKPVDIAV